MTLLPRFLDCVSKCKRVNEMSAQQMLLDLHSLKTLFLQLPTVGQNETDELKYVIPPTLAWAWVVRRRYMKFVNKAVDKADMMLKLLGTPVTYLASSIHNMWRWWCGVRCSMPDGTEEDLVTILTVKGATKAEKAECVEEFRKSEWRVCCAFGQFSSVTHRRNQSQTQHESNHCCFTLHALCIVWHITAPSHIPFLDSDFSTTPFPRLSSHHHSSPFLHFSPLHRIL